MAQRGGKRAMKVLKNAVAALALLAMIGGCSAWGQRGYVEVSERSANYTEMYIDYVIYDPNDKSVGLSGDVEPFSKGGDGRALMLCTVTWFRTDYTCGVGRGNNQLRPKRETSLFTWRSCNWLVSRIKRFV